MINYEKRFRLPNGKWAFQQSAEVSARARSIVAAVEEAWSPPPSFFHLRSGGHVAATKLHQANYAFGKIDLSNFFGQISRNRIIRSLKRLGMTFREAESIAIESTVSIKTQEQKFVLPFGFVQSPVLASIVLDQSDLGRLLRQGIGKTTVSAYVDDIVVSACDEDEVRFAFDRLISAADQSNFTISEQKSVRSAPVIEVFNILLEQGSIRLTDERLAEFVTTIDLEGKSARSFGVYRYIRSVNQDQANLVEQSFPWLLEPHTEVEHDSVDASDTI